MTTDNLLEGLNQAQQQAVQHVEGPLLIVAGPGSGKTRVIVHRVAYLMQERMVRDGNICVLTFTNKAAKELQARLGRLMHPRRSAHYGRNLSPSVHPSAE